MTVYGPRQLEPARQPDLLDAYRRLRREIKLADSASSLRVIYRRARLISSLSNAACVRARNEDERRSIRQTSRREFARTNRLLADRARMLRERASTDQNRRSASAPEPTAERAPS